MKMSWLSLAKNALKEAQSKIDKVLDIQGDEDESIKENEELDSTALEINKNILDSNTIIVKAPTVDNNRQFNQSENDKLLRRISELNEILESREMRLLEVSRQNTLLIEKNAEFQTQLETKQKNRELFESGEKQRLSTLEKKHQFSIRERDSLREQLNSLLSKVPKDDLNKIITEKDKMIEELHTEGGKLSKQILNLSDIVKKLRFKERNNTSNLKKNKEQIENLTDEVDRLKKSLTAKDELERTQIDAVNKLSSTNEKLEKENQILKDQIEDLTSKLTTLKNSFEAAKIELRNKHQIHFELSKKAQIAQSLETEKIRNENRNQEIMLQLEELRYPKMFSRIYFFIPV